MFEFYKDIFYSDFVHSRLNQEELQISQLYYVNGLIHILASLYKSKLDKKYIDINAKEITIHKGEAVVNALKEACKSSFIVK